MAELGQLVEAIDHFRRALALRPDYFESHLNMANALVNTQQRFEAVVHYRHALALRPDSPDAFNGLGLTLTELRRWPEATVYLRQAIRLRPDFAEAHNSLGLALVELGRYAEAEAAYHEALRLDPRYVEAHTNLATCYGLQQRMTEAFASYDIALWLRPDNVPTRWNRSLALLQTGQYAEGFKEYEWRWKRSRSPMRPMPRPMWGGSDPAGKTLLLWCEQGLGDAVQFCRCARLLKERGANVVLECPSPLAKVLPTCPGVGQIVAEGQPPPEYAFHAPLMSLPRLLGTTLDNVPSEVPYLRAEAGRVEHWKAKLAGVQGLKVGVAWHGNPHHQWDRHRSVPLALFEPLARAKGVTLFSLQRGPGAEQVEALAGRVPVQQVLGADLSDAEAWAEVAAAMVNLDLVITVDTATAHVAGALGVPTWVLLSYISDWRWMLGREDSPWYPTMRLFRQRRLGDWPEVIARAAAELRSLPLRRCSFRQPHLQPAAVAGEHSAVTNKETADGQGTA